MTMLPAWCTARSRCWPPESTHSAEFESKRLMGTARIFTALINQNCCPRSAKVTAEELSAGGAY